MVTWYWMRLFSILAGRRLGDGWKEVVSNGYLVSAGRRLDDGWKEVVSNSYLVLDEIVQHLQQEED